jgi:arylsulfatase A-like enzyme
VSEAVWYFADFLPTAAALANADAPVAVDGVDVRSALLGEEDSLPDRFLYWEKRREDPVRLEQAVRWGNWKAFRAAIDGPLELYDLAADIGEKNNVSARHPDVVARIESYLAGARTPSPYWPLDGE